MNTVGKILTGVVAFLGILVLTLSVVMFTFSPDWKGRAAAKAEELKEEQEKSQKLQTELDGLNGTYAKEAELLNANVAALDKAVAAGATDVENLEAQRVAAEKQLQDAISKTQEAQSSLKDVLAQRTDLLGRIDATKAERDKWFDTAVRMTDELNQRKTELSSLLASNESLVADMDRFKKILEKEQIDPATLVGKPLPLDAHIVETLDAETGKLVTVSAGVDQGLKKGDTLEVFRQVSGAATYLGKVEVVDPQADRSVCKVLPEFTTGAIEQGDQVSSTLK
ncbi:MAG: hypothetical protein PHE53_03795 [Thermoguttaceae bacterium]|nr:hypothetical protein [Thermoguttaceae bacterium]